MCKLYYVPNYGNEKFIIDVLDKESIKPTKSGLRSGLGGCDSPDVMIFNEDRGTINQILSKHNTPDTWWIQK